MEDKIAQFFINIYNESKNHLKKLLNNEYIITNIFKSEVVEKNSICKERKNFTFNFG